MKLFNPAPFAAAVAAVALAAPASQAQDKAPPSWDSLVKCAEMSDPADELACYRAAMRAQGYKPNVQAVETQRRKLFGLSLPSVNLAQREPKGDKPASAAAGQAAGAPEAEETSGDRVDVVLAQVAMIPPNNRLLLITSDGAIWEQTDTEVVNPRPKAGDRLNIRRTNFGGYFCRFSRVNSVRCRRTR